MSNTISNRITITGPREQIDQLLSRAYESKENPFSFDKLLPMPDTLKCVAGYTTTAVLGIVLYEENGGIIPEREAYDLEFSPLLRYYPTRDRKSVITKSEYDSYCSSFKSSAPKSDDMSYLFDAPGWISNPKSLEDARYLGRVYMDNIEKYGAPNWYQWVHNNWGCRGTNNDAVIEDDGSDTIYVETTTGNCPPDKLFQNIQSEFPDLSFSGEYTNGELEDPDDEESDEIWKNWSVRNMSAVK